MKYVPKAKAFHTASQFWSFRQDGGEESTLQSEREHSAASLWLQVTLERRTMQVFQKLVTSFRGIHLKCKLENISRNKAQEDYNVIK